MIAKNHFRVAANILYKERRIIDRGWPSSFDVASSTSEEITLFGKA